VRHGGPAKQRLWLGPGRYRGGCRDAVTNRDPYSHANSNRYAFCMRAGNANADGNGESDCNCHSYCNCDCYANGDGNCNSDCYSNSDSNGNTDTYSNAQTDADAEVFVNAEGSSYSAAEAIRCVCCSRDR
jgi:hypothetical protein